MYKCCVPAEVWGGQRGLRCLALACKRMPAGTSQVRPDQSCETSFGGTTCTSSAWPDYMQLKCACDLQPPVVAAMWPQPWRVSSVPLA